MPPLLEILAAGQSRDGQWVVIVIVFAIWLISAIVNTANKKADQVRQQQLKNAMQAIPPAVQKPVQLAPGIAMRVPAQVRTPVRTPARAPVRAPARAPNYPPLRKPASSTPTGAMIAANLATMQQRRAVVPPPIPSNRVVITAPSRPDISASEITSAAPTPPSKPSVGATALHRWLRPETLRQQFIITEVLQQPVALRQPRLS